MIQTIEYQVLYQIHKVYRKLIFADQYLLISKQGYILEEIPFFLSVFIRESILDMLNKDQQKQEIPSCCNNAHN